VAVAEPTASDAKPASDAPIGNRMEAVIQLIKKLDDGSGAPIEQLVEANPEAESILTTLMAEGEIFEIKPGRVKVLE
jgi:hypothetical protein